MVLRLIGMNIKRVIQIISMEIKDNKKWSVVKTLHNSLIFILKWNPKKAPALKEQLNSNKTNINKCLGNMVWIDELDSASPIEVKRSSR